MSAFGSSFGKAFRGQSESVLIDANLAQGTMINTYRHADAAPYDGTVTAMSMFLNFIVANDASNATGVGTFNGTVTVSWINLTNN